MKRSRYYFIFGLFLFTLLIPIRSNAAVDKNKMVDDLLSLYNNVNPIRKRNYNDYDLIIFGDIHSSRVYSMYIIYIEKGGGLDSYVEVLEDGSVPYGSYFNHSYDYYADNGNVYSNSRYTFPVGLSLNFVDRLYYSDYNLVNALDGKVFFSPPPAIPLIQTVEELPQMVTPTIKTIVEVGLICLALLTGSLVLVPKLVRLFQR